MYLHFQLYYICQDIYFQVFLYAMTYIFKCFSLCFLCIFPFFANGDFTFSIKTLYLNIAILTSGNLTRKSVKLFPLVKNAQNDCFPSVQDAQCGFFRFWRQISRLPVQRKLAREEFPRDICIYMLGSAAAAWGKFCRDPRRQISRPGAQRKGEFKILPVYIDICIDMHISFFMLLNLAFRFPF